MIIAGILAVAVFAIAVFTAMSLAKKQAAAERRQQLERAKVSASAVIAAAKLDAVTKASELQAATEPALDPLEHAKLDQQASQLDQREAELSRLSEQLRANEENLEVRQAAFDESYKELNSLRDSATGIERDANKRIASISSVLEQRASANARQLIDEMCQRLIVDAQSKAAAAIRMVEQTATDPAYDREAKRLMEIAGARYHHHYLTERNVATLRCGPDIAGLLFQNDAAIAKALEAASGIPLIINDDRDAVRMDGIDGVGREVIRRAIGRFERKPESVEEAKRNPEGWAAKAKDSVAQEIRNLGKRAFATLGVAKSHPEIMDLVGALNYRTSYTQNQWWHAVESAYLAGMIAAEMGLDEKMARRATLMHDIGKALTHKIDGSHAVIGADIARRLGEAEIVANAIGSHHNDEPQNSVYAYLTAAADAMSGARPGARREMAEGFSAKVEDLERIGSDRRGVMSAHAVHGGRELRVYVRERDVDDAAVVEMSGEIAEQISAEMTFPGQIKVTVIRSFEAVATAS